MTNRFRTIQILSEYDEVIQSTLKGLLSRQEYLTESIVLHRRLMSLNLTAQENKYAGSLLDRVEENFNLAQKI